MILSYYLLPNSHNAADILLHGWVMVFALLKGKFIPVVCDMTFNVYLHVLWYYMYAIHVHSRAETEYVTHCSDVQSNDTGTCTLCKVCEKCMCMRACMS